MVYSIQPAPASGGEWVWSPERSSGQSWNCGAPQCRLHRAGRLKHQPTGLTGLTGFDELRIPAEQAKKMSKESAKEHTAF